MNRATARELGRAGKLSWLVDLGVVMVVVAVFWAQPLLAVRDVRMVAVGAALGVAVAAAVLTRWVFPSVAPVIAMVATGAGWALQVNTDPMLAAAWCLYPLALQRGVRTRVIGLVAVLVVILASMTSGNLESSTGIEQRLVTAITVLGAAWLLGHVEARRLESVRRAVQQQAAYDHALRQTAMARDVHDIVGHALSVISAEADVARTIPGSTDEELRESLAGIEQRSRSALEQVQALVRALRSGDTAYVGATPLRELVVAAQVSGLEVDASIDLPVLPSDTDVVVSRVVQEALSNVVRHSGATRCEVAVWPDDKAVTVRIDDDGVGLPSRQTPGSGLTGMRERVEGVGGTLTVTNRLEGGTRVLARLPLEVAS